MTLIALMSLSMAISISLILSHSPLGLGLQILALALSLSLLLSFSTFHWLGLFMFIIYVGGLLVMFAYFVALSPNLILSSKSTAPLSALAFFISALVIPLSPLTTLSFSSFTMNPTLGALFFLFNVWGLIFMAIVLLFTLVAVVKISTSTAGPLRPFVSP